MPSEQRSPIEVAIFPISLPQSVRNACSMRPIVSPQEPRKWLLVVYCLRCLDRLGCSYIEHHTILNTIPHLRRVTVLRLSMRCGSRPCKCICAECNKMIWIVKLNAARMVQPGVMCVSAYIGLAAKSWYDFGFVCCCTLLLNVVDWVKTNPNIYTKCNSPQIHICNKDDDLTIGCRFESSARFLCFS